MTLQTNFYFLSPVEVVRVTPKNLEEVAEWCGGKVAETESRRVEGRMDKYVWVPTPKGSAISWAFPGMFITKRVVITENDELKVTYSVFRKAYFKANYFQSPDIAVENTWDRQQREAGKATHPSNGVTPKDLKDQIKPQLAARAVETPHGMIAVEDVKPFEGSLDNVQTIPEVAAAGSNMVEQRAAYHEHLISGAGNPDRA